MSFTWFNVNSSYKNQLINYSSDNGSTFKEITFPAGVWNYTDFNTQFKDITKIAKDGAENNEYPITLEFDNTTFRVTITLAQNYQLDLTSSNFNDLIRFDKEILKSQSNIGPKVPNLSQDTDILNIHCDLINDSLVDGQDSDILYSFSTTVPLKGKLPPLVSFLARRVSFLARRVSFLARRVSFLSRITDAFSMAYITRKKPDMCNGCCSAVRWQIDGTVQPKICISFISA